MHQPPGFVDKENPHHVCKLDKALYGLKQAPRTWNARFSQYLKQLGFVTTRSDASLFVYSHNNDLAYLLLYVDDIILTGSSKSLLHRITNSLKNEFPMSDMGRLKYFLRIKVEYNAARILLSQKNYASEIIQRAEMSNCKPILTPADLNSKLSSEAGARISNPKHYRSLARARQDISYAVQQLCLFMHDPREQHYTALKRIIRYIQGTLSYGLQIYKTKIDSLTAYYDADWARCPDTRRQPGFLVFQTTTNCLQIQRRSRKQGVWRILLQKLVG